ncbi:mitochondrial 37S ribosomal protein mS41 [Calcarisporiella thermophila]|uniref:mitochondrial 37S ribosomal protein mS41 n=1 Tax=Calcarisporiella thermophila TaxID=911321 RepID=UPI0037430873
MLVVNRLVPRSLNLLKRWSHSAVNKSVPSPRGDVSDPTTFLQKIGRGCEGVADKFKDWNHLFTATSLEMKEMGLTPKQRKWILAWTEHYRAGRELKTIPLKPPKKKK